MWDLSLDFVYPYRISVSTLWPVWDLSLDFVYPHGISVSSFHTHLEFQYHKKMHPQEISGSNVFIRFKFESRFCVPDLEFQYRAEISRWLSWNLITDFVYPHEISVSTLRIPMVKIQTKTPTFAKCGSHKEAYKEARRRRKFFGGCFWWYLRKLILKFEFVFPWDVGMGGNANMSFNSEHP